ncbi:MAG: hypothetical protein ACOXZR_04180 [Bacilli bacterium]
MLRTKIDKIVAKIEVENKKNNLETKISVAAEYLTYIASTSIEDTNI